MPALRDFQQQFAAGLAGDGAPLSGLKAVAPVPLDVRFRVYQNNVYAGLIDALGDAVPVVRQLVGEAFFRAMIREYLKDHLPTSRTLIGFGADLPDFLAGFEPVGSLPYLADTARLELAWLESYHAAACPAVASQVLGALAPEDMMAARYDLSDSVRLLRSSYPVVSIWEAHQPTGTPASVRPDLPGEDAMIVRSGNRVYAVRLGVGAFEFIHALLEGKPMADAIAAAGSFDAFDLTTALHLLIQHEAITAITVPDKEEIHD